MCFTDIVSETYYGITTSLKGLVEDASHHTSTDTSNCKKKQAKNKAEYYDIEYKYNAWSKHVQFGKLKKLYLLMLLCQCSRKRIC